MQDPLHAALLAWRSGDAAPLVAALGFHPPTPGPARSESVLGHAGSTLAVRLTCAPSEAAPAARAAQARDPLRQRLFFVHTDACRLELLALGPDGEPRRLALDLERPRLSDLDTLREMAGPADSGIALFLRHYRALDRRRVTGRFFEAFRAMRAQVAVEWRHVPLRRRRERERLALLFLCRLLFLYFLQKDGRLAGRTDYFRVLRQRYARLRTGRSFYRVILIPLFHGALNRRPAERTAAASRLGRLPYLNGGLFERDSVEERYPRLDLPNPVADAVFDELLERYRFTTREHASALQDDGADGAIDPEMLGRVFEGLMDPDLRGRTGTFFTPPALVDDVVRQALAARIADHCAVPLVTAHEWLLRPETADPSVLDAVNGIRVLDPACGSGAFLLGVLTRITALRRAHRAAPDPARLVGEALHGIDLQEDAALLCALRLWLVLATTAGRRVPPLPNLERRIRQGDALLDPLDLPATRDTSARSLLFDPDFRRAALALSQAAREFLVAEPATKRSLAPRIRELEVVLAEQWLAAQLTRLLQSERELRAAVEARDLFGRVAGRQHPLHPQLRDVQHRLCEIRTLRARLRRRRSVPFFSYLVHFADVMPGGFDLVLSNPPWVRSHRWPTSTARLLRERYVTCHEPGWQYGMDCVGSGRGVGAQVDLAVLFLELGLRVLRPGGILGMLLPAKLLRSLFAGGARRLLLEQADIVHIDDRSLDSRASFDADAFVVTLIVRRKSGRYPQRNATVTLHRAGSDPLAFTLDAAEMPLVRDDHASPWLLAPAEARAALRTMQRAGPPLGSHAGISIRRGVMTGANDVLVLQHAEPRLGRLSRIRAGAARAHDDEFTAVVETDCIRPLLRGSDIRAWQHGCTRHVVWLYDDSLRLRRPPRHLARYLARHQEALDSRSPRSAPGALFRLSRTLLDSLVAWRDLAPQLQAVALPRSGTRPVPLNSVYFAGVGRDDDAAFVLAAYLNSLPCRAFTRAVAERAKDGYFRFFAWTLAVMPLPADWRTAHAPELIALSRAAHAQGRMDADAQARVDGIVANRYRLLDDDVRALREFDLWLSGGPS